MTSLKKSKALIRSALLDRRNRLSAENQAVFSKKISRTFLELPEILEARDIAIYWSHHGEVSTEDIFKQLRRLPKKVYLPRVNEPRSRLDFVPVEDASQLMKGAFGVYEPEPHRKAIPLSQIQVMVVPGIAFDEQGRRIGWGKGYYDRALKKFSGVRIALAYDFQVMPQLPAGARDEPVQWIVTELRVIKCKTSK